MVLRLYAGEAEKLEKILLQEGAQKKGSNLVINGVTLSLYKRKLVINAEDHALARFIVGFLTPIKPHGGSDEAGKGDLFGPLVVAGTFLEDQLAMRLAIDSKELSNGAVEKLAQFFKSKCQVVIEQVLPHELTSNMNAVLLKLHLNVYEELDHCRPFYVDDFGATAQLRSHGLVPIYRGEVIPAVAAASVVARATFLNWLKEHNLPAGSSREAQQVAVNIASEQGCSALRNVAKANFSLVRRLCVGGEQNLF
ncbi:ribonuclease HIII [Coprothermobacter proteolyticus DSM 5265]|uniref:Ribonuclease n=2 Tax=Coprothermobacter TaxID=68335 RepID=B5Y9A0_COPPD|nr:ribonuclease HIII [Coprothermobacter proteolyticus DSM 5265]